MFKALCLILTLTLITALPAPVRAAGHFDTLAGGGAGGWLNVTRPLTSADMAGRMVLLDFWTYGCINCMQIVPELDALEEKFGDKLLVLGVHSAKFEGERENSRILAAAKRFGLKHPVINDSDYAVWKSFGVNAWPTLILLGPDGDEIARYTGEGHGKEIDAKISGIIDTIGPVTALHDVIAPDEAGQILSFPARLATDGKTIFIADTGHNRIIAIDPSGKVQFTIGTGQRGFADGDFKAAQFNRPRGLATDGAILYVADTDNHRVRAVNLKDKTVTTLSGTGEKRKPLSSPWDVELLADGKLAIANAGSHQIFSFDIAAKKLSALAGSGAENIDDGPAATATLAQPSGLSRLGDTLYFVDAESSALRTLSHGVVKTLIGVGLFDFGAVDGAYPAARLQHPQGLAATSDGQVVIADTYNNALRLYDGASQTLRTLPLPAGSLNEPGDVIVIGDAFWVANSGAHIITIVNPSNNTVRSLEIQN